MQLKDDPLHNLPKSRAARVGEILVKTYYYRGIQVDTKNGWMWSYNLCASSDVQDPGYYDTQQEAGVVCLIRAEKALATSLKAVRRLIKTKGIGEKK